MSCNTAFAPKWPLLNTSFLFTHLSKLPPNSTNRRQKRLKYVSVFWRCYNQITGLCFTKSISCTNLIKLQWKLKMDCGKIYSFSSNDIPVTSHQTVLKFVLLASSSWPRKSLHINDLNEPQTWLGRLQMHWLMSVDVPDYKELG